MMSWNERRLLTKRSSDLHSLSSYDLLLFREIGVVNNFDFKHIYHNIFPNHYQPQPMSSLLTTDASSSKKVLPNLTFFTPDGNVRFISYYVQHSLEYHQFIAQEY